MTKAAPAKLIRIGWLSYQTMPCQHPAAELASYLNEVFSRQEPRVRFTGEEVKGYDLAQLSTFELAFLTPYAYVQASSGNANRMSDGGRFNPIVSYEFRGARERFSTIVWKEAAGNTLAELLATLQNDRSKKLALVNPRSTSGYLWPFRLLGGGLDLGRGRISTIFSDDHDQALNDMQRYDEVVAAATFDSHLRDYVAKHKDFPRHKAAVLTPSLPLDVLAGRQDLDQALADRIRTAMIAMHTTPTFKRCFSPLLDRWVEVADSYYDIVRAFMNIVDDVPQLRLVNCASRQRRAWLETEINGWFGVADLLSHPAATLDCERTDEELIADLGRVRQSSPIVGYLDEEDYTKRVASRLSQGAMNASPEITDVRANFGARRGIVQGMVANVTFKRWLADGGARIEDGMTFPARITRVEGDDVFLRPAAERNWSTLKQSIDPNDHVILAVEVLGYSTDNEGKERQADLRVQVVDASITTAGSMEVVYEIEVRDKQSGDPLDASGGGWLIAVEDKVRDRTVSTRVLLIEPNRSKKQQTITLSGSAVASKVVARLLGAPTRFAPAPRQEPFGLWSAFSAWTYLILGGAIGTALRWTGLATQERTVAGEPSTQPGRRRARQVVRRLVELFSGMGAAFLLFAVLVTVKRPDALQALDSAAAVTRLFVGVVGGAVGASGIASLAHRLVGLKD